MSRNTLLARLTPLIRNLTDLSLKLSGKLIAYDNVTVYRYAVRETEYKDKVKTLLQTVKKVHMFIDFPGEVPLLNTLSGIAAIKSVTFIEDMLPISALFPWKHNGKDLKVDVDDEFEITLYDEFKNEHLLRFEITERKSDFVEQHVYRDFIVVPKRESPVTLQSGARTGSQTGGQTGGSADPNINVGETNHPVYSEYDNEDTWSEYD